MLLTVLLLLLAGDMATLKPVLVVMCLLMLAGPLLATAPIELFVQHGELLQTFCGGMQCLPTNNAQTTQIHRKSRIQLAILFVSCSASFFAVCCSLLPLCCVYVQAMRQPAGITQGP